MKMKRINRGNFDYNALTYTKKVTFSKAVLWKDRQLSLPLFIMREIENSGIKKLVFIDSLKKEIWRFNAKKVLENSIVKKVGQEPQCYFPIELATKLNFNEPPEIKSLVSEPIKIQDQLF